MKRIFAIVILLLLVSCSADSGTIGTKSKRSGVDTMGKVLFVIAHKDFQDKELLVPKHVLQDHEILIASTETTTARGTLGAELTPDITLKDALKRINEFDAVIFVGGSGAKDYFNDPTALQIAKNAKNIIAAICVAPIILANAGVLNGKRATVWDDGRGTQRKMIESRGAGYVDEPVVVVDKVVTANGPDAARLFAERIKTLLEAD